MGMVFEGGGEGQGSKTSRRGEGPNVSCSRVGLLDTLIFRNFMSLEIYRGILKMLRDI